MPTLDLDGWKVSYQESGVGLPLICIPGIEEYKESFLYQLRGLSDHYRVISYDLREAADGQADNADVLAEDLKKFMDSLRLSAAVVIGHCFGGLVAQRFASIYPQRTAALVLLSTFAKAPTTHPATLLRAMSSGHLNDPDSPWQRFLQKLGMYHPPEPEVDDHLLWVSRQAAKTSRETLQQRLKLVRAFDSRPYMEQIWMPTLLMVGDRDRTPFLSSAQFMEGALPEPYLEVIEGAGHFPHIERHDLVNQYLDEFLAARLTALLD